MAKPDQLAYRAGEEGGQIPHDVSRVLSRDCYLTVKREVVADENVRSDHESCRVRLVMGIANPDQGSEVRVVLSVLHPHEGKEPIPRITCRVVLIQGQLQVVNLKSCTQDRLAGPVQEIHVGNGEPRCCFPGGGHVSHVCFRHYF